MATFVRVVDAGSMSGAARSLPSSLTSVIRQISALEQRFGTQLLLRTTRHLALTDDGRMFYERAKSILGELKEVEAAWSAGRPEPSGRIRVSAPTLIGRLLIAPLLAELHRQRLGYLLITSWSDGAPSTLLAPTRRPVWNRSN